jgi:Inner membrane protein CreD
MLKHIAAIVFILCASAVAWVILGSTVFQRTYRYNSGLRDKVIALWGSSQEQRPPAAIFGGATPVPLAPESSRIEVDLNLEHRQKGLLWYSTYAVKFTGVYVFRNDTASALDLGFTWQPPAEKAVYSDLLFTIDGVTVTPRKEKDSWNTTARIPAGAPAEVRIAYRSQGLDTWRYAFGTEMSQVRDFTLRVRTNFSAVDFLENTLSPSEKHRTSNGWEMAWTYKTLLSGYNIGIAMPAHAQPGPLAGAICYFAPVSLLFFFFVLFMFTMLEGVRLHPMNYFFLAAAFFAFHLLFAYLVDHISIETAFLISSAVSVGLVVSYLRLVAGARFAMREAGIAQFVYLVLFSFSFFFEGYTGLAITIGAIVTLFVAMQMTGRVDWSRRFHAPVVDHIGSQLDRV